MQTIAQNILQTTAREIIEKIALRITEILDPETRLTNHIAETITTYLVKTKLTRNIRPRNIKYQNRSQKHSQPLYPNNPQYSDRQNHNTTISTPQYHQQIIQLQTRRETTADPPGIENFKTLKWQLKHIHYESTDDENENKSTLVIENRTRMWSQINFNNYQNEYPFSTFNESSIYRTTEIFSFKYG